MERLVKVASIEGNTYIVTPYFTDLLYLVKDHCSSYMKDFFDLRSKTKGIWYKNIQPNLLGTPWFANAKLSKCQIRCRVFARDTFL